MKDFIKKNKLKKKTNVDQLKEIFRASKGSLLATIKLKNKILNLEEQNSSLGIDFDKNQLKKLKKQISHYKSENEKLMNKNNDLDSEIENNQKKLNEINQKIDQMNVEKEDQKIYIKGLKSQCDIFEKEALKIQKDMVISNANLEQIDIRKKELLNEKNVTSKWDGSRWDNENEHFQILDEISINSLNDLTKPVLKEFLIKIKNELHNVKQDLQRVSGNLNSQEFIKNEKDKVDKIKSQEAKIKDKIKSKILFN
jgi:chromosome segregation ATPase